MEYILTRAQAQELFDLKVFVDVLVDREWTRCNGIEPSSWESTTFRLGNADLECKDRDDDFMRKKSFIYFQEINNRSQNEAKTIRDCLSI